MIPPCGCTAAYLTRYSSRRSSAFRSHTPCGRQQDEVHCYATHDIGVVPNQWHNATP